MSKRFSKKTRLFFYLIMGLIIFIPLYLFAQVYKAGFIALPVSTITDTASDNKDFRFVNLSGKTIFIPNKTTEEFSVYG